MPGPTVSLLKPLAHERYRWARWRQREPVFVHGPLTGRAADRLAVSRTVVREAVRVLESMGLLASRRRLGITVLPAESWNPFDPSIIRWRLTGRQRADHLHHLAELRTAVEPLAARIAALRAGPDDCGDLTRTVIGMGTAVRLGDNDRYLAHDLEFHRIVLRACGNPLLAGLTEALTVGRAGQPPGESRAAPTGPDPVRRHAELVTSVHRGDADAAERAMRDIVAGEHRVSAMSGSPAASPPSPARPESARMR
jgi:DNA-binding FadR family transcriptional regulator